MAPRELTTTAYLTLGLLSARDWSAYQLAEQLGRGVEELWPRADRQRYNTLKRLLDEGFVTARTERTGKRDRTVYSITPEGSAALTDWLATESRPPALESEGLVRVLLADRGDIDDLRRTIESTRAAAETKRAMFAAYASFISETGGTFPERRHLFALANTFMIGHYEHIIEWSTWALDQIADWPDAVSPATTHVDQVRDMLAPGREVWAQKHRPDDTDSPA